MSGNKSDWTSGTYLNPTFAQSYFGTLPEEGHNHTGSDASNSAPQINLSDSVADYTTGTIPIVCPPPFSDASSIENMTFTKIGDVITLSFPTGVFVHSTANESMQIYPDPHPGTEWPALMMPVSAQYLTGWMAKEIDGGEFRFGGIAIPAVGSESDPIIAYIDSTGQIVYNDFGSSGSGPKGIFNGSYTYKVG